MSDETPGYRGVCNLCGTKDFFPAVGRSTRESFACPNCRAALRWRDQAAIILDEFACGQSVFLQHLVRSGKLDDVDVYEVALRGPLKDRLKVLPRYVSSYFWPDRPLGSVGSDGVRCEDLTRLTFPDDSFDLVLTSDVMEHVYDIHAAFAEIARVLKPGGIHVFSIPNDWPFPDRSEPRVELVDGQENFLKPARYHVSGDGSPCIVTWDYGADIVAILAELGCRTQVVRRHSGIDPCYVNATFVMRKRG